MTHDNDVTIGTRPKIENRVVDSSTDYHISRRGTLTLRKSGGSAIDVANARSDESQRIIIVSYSYAPLLNPRSFRWTAIAERWAQEGKRIDIVCAWEPGLETTEYRNQVHIHRVGGGVIERFRSLLRAKDRGTLPHTDTNVTTASNTSNDMMNSAVAICKSGLKSLIRKAHDVTWKNLYWPDYATLWAKPAIKQARILLNNNAAETVTLITVSDPFTAHVVGRALKRNLPELRWVVDIGDPFCYRHDIPTNNHTLYRALNYRYESKVFAEANSISVTTEATKQKYEELLPSAESKITVIPPLVSLSAISEADSPLGNSSAIKALFTGALYRQIRNPQYLLQLFAGLRKMDSQRKIELHFFGLHEDCKSIFAMYEAELRDCVVLHGLMPRNVTAAALKQADLLVNIGNANPYQLPSKVVEYACSSKPIINIACIDNDSSAEFFADRPNTLTVNTADGCSLNTHVAALSEFVNSVATQSSPSVSESYHEQIRNKHSIETITASYSELLCASDSVETSTRQPVCAAAPQ